MCILGIHTKSKSMRIVSKPII